MTRLRWQNNPGRLLLAALCVGGASCFLVTTPARPTVMPQQASSSRPWQLSWDQRAATTILYFDRRRKPCRDTSTARSAASTDWEGETDPFRVLGIGATADPKEIKRAYRRLALKFHPDVVTNKDSTAAEKQAAGDRFAKVNWAYQSLKGKDRASASRGSSSSSSSSSSSGWTPPHRRSGTSSSSSQAPPSTDWRDYMPNYGSRDEPQYDKGDDSFSKIFSDLFQGAAGGVAAGGVSGAAGGIFKDFVDFLEDNVDGVAGSDASENDLRILLQTGSRTEITNEMDDTQLLVDQLETKLRKLQDDLWSVGAEVKLTSTFRERIELEESQAELTARVKVVQSYDRQARKRLIVLQTRYKELVVSGFDDRVTGRRQNSQDSYTSSSSTRRDPDPPRRETSTGGRTSTTTSSSSPADQDEAWKREGFGSFGRRGSGGRSRRRRPTREDTPSPEVRSRNASSSQSSPPPSSTAGSSRSSTRPTSSPSVPSSYGVPPHRRTSSPPPVDDKRRLRELQVDDEFEKLKKELGL